MTQRPAVFSHNARADIFALFSTPYPQTPVETVPPNASVESREEFYEFMETNPLDFDKAYWLSQPPEVRALEVNTTPDEDTRMNRCIGLAVKGFKIDVPIMIWGWDPFKVMKLRIDFGYTWVPNALQPPVGIAPGLTAPNIVPYDPNHPPGGAIKVSIDLADYPPFDPPIPVTPVVPVTDPVGTQSLGKLYFNVPGNTYIDGDKFTDSRGTFLKHIYLTPFGSAPIWEKI